MAKTLNVSRADAYTAVADVWAMLAADAEGDIVKGWTLEMLDAVVELPMAGCGAVMLQAGLVGVVDDGLVLPPELRRHERDERGGAAAAAEQGDGQNVDPKILRRRESGKISARKYRRKNKLLGKTVKPSCDKAWRSLGRVAGHEVRAFDGQFGPYVMVIGATVNGASFTKFTTGNKAWTLDTVRLVDALPALVEKWKEKSRPRGLELTGPTLVPSYADFRDDAERLTALAKYQAAAEAEAARHADGDDASSRHADASAASAGPSADPEADGERKSLDDMGFDASAASANRHADAPSSMSYPSKSSSSNEEEDMGNEGGKAAADHEPDQGDAEPDGMAEYDQRQAKRRRMAQLFADALGKDVETILRLFDVNKPYLRSLLEAAGIDPNTGLPVARGASHEPAGACGDTGMTTEASGGDKPAAGSAGARDGDELGHGNREPSEFDCSHEDLRRGLQRQGVPVPVVKTPPAEENADVDAVSVGA